MTSWQEFADEAPELAAEVKRRFDAHGHKTMATVRSDGSPRISGTEVEFRDGQIWLGSMSGALKARDLQRDPRVAIHSASEDPAVWSGDAKVAGRAVEVEHDEPHHLFRIELSEAVSVRLPASREHLIIESWHEGRGVTRTERA
ncbi:MAG: pyridoxamine 5'-phosphate oxidase family protein [Candidatus Nanopelagicales bacterium]